MQTHLVAQDDLIIAHSVQDVSPILEACKTLAKEGVTGSSELKHAATFPMVLIETYMNKIGINFQEFMRNPQHAKTMLNDPDLKGFRVWQGQA